MFVCVYMYVCDDNDDYDDNTYTNTHTHTTTTTTGHALYSPYQNIFVKYRRNVPENIFYRPSDLNTPFTR